MNKLIIFFLVTALVFPASASSVNSWTQVNVPGLNLTLNYTDSFNVSKNDTLGISIKNIGNGSFNDTISVYEINVPDTGEATGAWTGNVILAPGAGTTIDFPLKITTESAANVDIRVHYNVSSSLKEFKVNAYYPGKAGEPTFIPPTINSWGNSKTNNDDLTLTANISEMIRFNATASQAISAWNWFRDDVAQNNNHDDLNTSWDTIGTKSLRVSATNANGTSNIVNWTVIIAAPHSPAITSWINSKTNNNNLTFSINKGEIVKFNITSDQPISAWRWKLNGALLANPSDVLIFDFDNEGTYRVAVDGSNSNGRTQTIVWDVNVERPEGKKLTILSWEPQVIDSVYVNDTISETIEYSVTTARPMMVNNWTIDGIAAAGVEDGNTYSLEHTWNNKSDGFHTITYSGSDTSSQVEFRWYVNVYGIEGDGRGSIFDIIDEALENHITDIKIRMFEYHISENNDSREFATQKVNGLHDEIARRQMTRETLLLEFKAGNITAEEYVAALKLAQREAKSNIKLAEELAKIARKELKDEKMGMEFENYSKMVDDWGEEGMKGKKKEDEGTKGHIKTKKIKRLITIHENED